MFSYCLGFMWVERWQGRTVQTGSLPCICCTVHQPFCIMHSERSVVGGAALTIGALLMPSPSAH